MMNRIIISFMFLATIFTACKKEPSHNDENGHAHIDEQGHTHDDENGHTHDDENGHAHDDENGHAHDEVAHMELEPLAYTIYTAKSELFFEFKPLVVGEKSKFAVHFTQLGEYFTAVTEGSVTVSLVGDEKQPISKADGPSSPGIFRLSLNPTNAGIYTLVFNIQTNEYSDSVVIDNVFVFPDTESAIGYSQENSIGEEIVFLKEQAWGIEFANVGVKKQNFTEIIKTTGQILPAQGDEVILTAKNSGIITFGNSKKLIGSNVNADETMFVISGKGLIENNLDAKYALAKANYEKAEREYERAKELVKDNIISQKVYHERQLNYEIAQTNYDNIANNYTPGGQEVKSPIKGYVKNILVTEGQYIETGQPIASVSQNRKLILRAEVAQKHFSKLNSISSANFKTAYDSKIYDTNNLNGKLISYGKSADNNAYYIPVNFEIDNTGEIISGSFIEVFLKANVIRNAIIIPYSALMEEQGNYYVYVQTSGEGFQKRELELGVNDGIYVQVLSGIMENERVVTKGAYQIKLATMSGKLPDHGHEH